MHTNIAQAASTQWHSAAVQGGTYCLYYPGTPKHMRTYTPSKARATGRRVAHGYIPRS